MPLNLGGDGNFIPYLKYNAKAGRFYARFNGIEGDVEVQSPRLVFDFANIKTGWIAFPQSGAPSMLWDKSLAEEAPKPEWDKVRRGFKVNVVGGDPVPAASNQKLGLREMMAVAFAFTKSINVMYEQWEADCMKHEGELPFFRCTGVVAIQGQHGTNYQPEFVLESWIPRDKLPELDNAPTDQPVNTLGNLNDPQPDDPLPDDPRYENDDIPF